MTAIKDWKAPNNSGRRSNWRIEKVFWEILLLSAMAKQSADRLTAMIKTDGKSIPGIN
jgi:hypothetical protein